MTLNEDTLRDAAADEAGRAELAVEATRDPAADPAHMPVYPQPVTAATVALSAWKEQVKHHGIHHEADTELAQMMREVRADVERLENGNEVWRVRCERLNNELTKAQDDAEALRTALDRLQRAYHALQRSHAPVSPVACNEGECGDARAALGEAAT